MDRKGLSLLPEALPASHGRCFRVSDPRRLRLQRTLHNEKFDISPAYAAKRAGRSALCILFSLFLAILSGLCPAQAEPLPITDVTSADQVNYTCLYGGEERKFLVCLPGQTDGPIPVIFMLHGSGSSGLAFRRDTAMDLSACKRGYAVVFVTAARNKISRTIPPAWNSGIGETGVDDAGFLTALAGYTWQAFHFDPHRTFLAGFSNGAFMVHRMAAEAGETFSAFAAVAGSMPGRAWDARTRQGKVNFLQINGTQDDTVPMLLNGTAQSAKAPAIEEVISWYVAEGALTGCTTAEYCPGTVLTRFTDVTGSAAVWFALIEGGHHDWPENTGSGFYANDLILDYFDAVSRQP